MVPYCTSTCVTFSHNCSMLFVSCFAKLHWLWSLIQLCWGLQGSSAFYKCLLVLVLYLASLRRAPWVCFMFRFLLTGCSRCNAQVHLGVSPRRNQFGWTPGALGAPDPLIHPLWSIGLWLTFRARPTFPMALPWASWQSSSGSKSRRCEMILLNPYFW